MQAAKTVITINSNQKERDFWFVPYVTLFGNRFNEGSLLVGNDAVIIVRYGRQYRGRNAKVAIKMVRR